MQSTISYPVSLGSTLILPFHLRLRLPSCLLAPYSEILDLFMDTLHSPRV